MSRGQTFAIEIGKEYGWLTVLSEAGRGKDGHLKYLVRCRCGKEYQVQRGFLRKPECKCVDCYKKLPHAAREPLNKPGDVINGWTIIDEVGKNEYGARLYQCKCPKCGQITVHTRGDLTLRKGKGCQLCKPEYLFRVVGNAAHLDLPGIGEIIIDADLVDTFSQYYWKVGDDGYVYRTNKNLPKMKLHWLAMGLTLGHEEIIIDHINRNRLDCRRSNLRIVTAQQNSMNKGMQANSTTGYRGVCFVKSKNKYMASIGLNNRKIAIGYSASPIECAQLYNYASELLFGEFCGYRNYVPELSNAMKNRIKEKLQKYMAEAIIARQPALTAKTA